MITMPPGSPLHLVALVLVALAAIILFRAIKIVPQGREYHRRAVRPLYPHPEARHQPS